MNLVLAVTPRNSPESHLGGWNLFKCRLDFAVGKQWRFGTGARWQFSDALTFDLCYELMWSGNLPADVNAGSLLGDIDGEFKKVFLQFIDINLTWAF